VSLELDHVFILVEPHAKVADLLLEFGLEEGFSRDHPGQGTSNRRFTFANGLLEFLWLRDSLEAEQGPGSALFFKERFESQCFESQEASPFGLVLNRTQVLTGMPFDGWSYQPDYFKTPMAFHVGANSSELSEPLCIYVPFMTPPERPVDDAPFRTITQVTIHTPNAKSSQVLKSANKADRLCFVACEQHLMELTLDEHQLNKSKDFRPNIPLIIHY